jgi:hypothetical protein
VLRKIFALKKYKVAEGKRKLHNKELEKFVLFAKCKMFQKEFYNVESLYTFIQRKVQRFELS